MYKESFYNIWHNNFLFNSLHRSVINFLPDEVDEIKRFLSNINELATDNKEITESFLKLGFICDSKLDEKNFLKLQNKKAIFANKEYRLTINPTLQCNYRCWYCCVEEQNTKYQHRRMDDNTINKIKKLIENLILKEHIQKLALDWFGGEPLMYFNEVVLPISQHALNLCNQHNIPFVNHATTNAFYISNDMINSFRTIKLNSFQIPIDGNKQKHNSVKNMKGIGHFDKIMDSINSIGKKIENSCITLRINYDKTTLDAIEEIIPYINKNIRSNILIDFQRVWQVEKNISETGNNEKLLQIKKKFEDAGFSTTYFAYCHKHFKCCYADSFYHWVINYDGNVYKCSARDYDESLIAGTIDDNGNLNFNPIVYDYFSNCTFDNPQCMNCKRLPLCYGQCMQKNYEYFKGNIPFQCLHQHSEVSLGEFIENLFIHYNQLKK